MKKLLAVVLIIINVAYSTETLEDDKQQWKVVSENQFPQVSSKQIDQLWSEEGIQEADPVYQVYSQAFSGVKLYGFSLQGNKGGRFFTNCGGRNLIGGYDTLGANGAIQFTEDLPQHTRLRLSTRLLKIDDWDGSTMMIIIDGQFAWQQKWQANTGLQYFCGKAGSVDADIPVVIEIKHTAQTANIIFVSNIKKDPSLASWGIREYQVEVI